MARLPIPGEDKGVWGDILNEYLLIEHNSDGTLKSGGSLGSYAPLSSPTFTGMVTVPSPTNPTDAVTKQYVDSALSGATAPDATTSSTGVVQLAGDLSGTATSPQIADGVISNDHVSASAGIAKSKLAALNIADADVAAGANIAQSKVANLTNDLSDKAELADWQSDNYGANKELSGQGGVLTREEGILTENCNITVALTDNQQVDLIVHQDGSGGHGITWSDVDVWLTTDGNAGVPGSAAGSTSRFYFERINGLTYGYHVTEEVQAAGSNVGQAVPLTAPNKFYLVPAGRSAGAALSVGKPHFVPLFVPVAKTITEVGIWVSTVATGSTVVAAIYLDDANGMPGTRVLNINSSSPWDTTTGNGFKVTTGMSQQLAPGTYWVAYLAVGGAPTVISTPDPTVGVPLPANPANGSSFYFRDSIGSRTSLPADVSGYSYEVTSSAPIFFVKGS
jgi:hypothetical protein